MKKIFFILMMFMSVLTFTSCSLVSVDGDEEACLVAKPVFFGSGGVSEDVVSAGTMYVAGSTDAVIFKITPIKYTEELENVMTQDNNPVHFAFYLTLQIEKGTTNTLFKNFGKEWYNNSLQPYVRTLCRDVASSNKSRDLMSNRKKLDSLQIFMLTSVERKIKELDLPVKVKDSNIGQILPSEAVIQETERTAANMQSILTQEARKKSEDSRKAAEIAKANADKAYRLEMGMTNQEYLKSVELGIIKDKSNVQIVYGVTPIYNVNK